MNLFSSLFEIIACKTFWHSFCCLTSNEIPIFSADRHWTLAAPDSKMPSASWSAFVHRKPKSIVLELFFPQASVTIFLSALPHNASNGQWSFRHAEIASDTLARVLQIKLLMDLGHAILELSDNRAPLSQLLHELLIRFWKSRPSSVRTNSQDTK